MIAQAVFFDLDDTLCDFGSAWKTGLDLAFEHVLGRYSHFEKERLHEAWSETWAELLPTLSDPGITMSSVRDQRFSHCFSKLDIEDDAFAVETNLLLGYRMLDHLKCYSDVSVLEPLRESWPTAIVTNGACDSHPDSQFSKAHHLGLLDRTDGFFASDTWGIRKPDPRFLIRCAEEMGIEPSNVLFVGDSPENDVAAANRAGMTSVLLWRHPQPPPDFIGEQRPRMVIHSLNELLNWVDFS